MKNASKTVKPVAVTKAPARKATRSKTPQRVKHVHDMGAPGSLAPLLQAPELARLETLRRSYAAYSGLDVSAETILKHALFALEVEAVDGVLWDSLTEIVLDEGVEAWRIPAADCPGHANSKTPQRAKHEHEPKVMLSLPPILSITEAPEVPHTSAPLSDDECFKVLCGAALGGQSPLATVSTECVTSVAQLEYEGTSEAGLAALEWAWEALGKAHPLALDTLALMELVRRRVGARTECLVPMEFVVNRFIAMALNALDHRAAEDALVRFWLVAHESSEVTA